MKRREALTLVKNEDQAKSRAWAKAHFSDAHALPISFVLDGQQVRGIPAAWQPTVATRRLDANLIETVITGRDPQSGLQVHLQCTAYQDFPVVEWITWFSNVGEQDTPILSDIRAVDTTFGGTSPLLYTCNGDYYSADGYTPTERPLPAGEVITLTPNGGRSCDGAFPYTRITFAEGGLTLAIGWPAQWTASFVAKNEGVEVQAGQEKTHLRLHPGERVVAPRITLLFWAGDGTRAVNLWRRWYLAHILPRPNGLPMQPLLTCCGTEEGEEFTTASEVNQLRFMDDFRGQGIDFDLWWIDAGWYPCFNEQGIRRWPITGTWQPDALRFPHGFKPVADHAATHDTDLLIWFEPERVRPGTQIATEHPEWLLHAEGSENGLLYLGNPLARQWLTDHVNRLIQANGITVYRQDFNFPPLAHWRQNDAADRQGIHENLHTQGYLQFWDDLLAANPGLWIDSCSSGGRRNDLETMRRSVPLHYTDYGYGYHPIKLAFQHTLFAWIPYFKEFTLSWDLEGVHRFDHTVDAFSYHCAFAPMLFVGMDALRHDYDYGLARTLIALWRRASDLLLFGDYYPLTPFSTSDQAWVVRQFDDAKQGNGFVQAIRLPNAPAATFIAHPQGIEAAAIYRFENGESGETQEISGATLLQQGLSITIPPRSGVVWFYQRQA